MSPTLDAVPDRPRHSTGRRAAPGRGSEVPPRRAVPSFPPIRAGCGRRHRLRQAVRGRPGPLAAGLAAVAALAVGPLYGTGVPSGRPGPAGAAAPHCVDGHRTGGAPAGGGRVAR
ncbi:hypothetical protein ACIQGZ_04480 [Streptomyces sp. NPDC092296]|uniref:hypothetical protein n=1 Tax=Streptomyces sp. NPDC092296 TaxID=3366012 RepID=UPI00380C2A10